MHHLPPYQDLESSPLLNAEACGADGLSLPTHAGLSEADIDRIVDSLDRILV